MNTVQICRALGLTAVVALATTVLPGVPAHAAPATLSLVATSHDGPAFDVADYAAGDITVQVEDGSTSVDVDDTQDLAYSWSVTPFGAGAATVQLPTTGTDTQATEAGGEFIVPLPISQGPGTYTLTAALGAGANGTAVPSAPLLTITTGNAVPNGTTATITGLGSGSVLPGESKAGELTVTAPGNVPVEGQVFSLTVDHGFFTSGDEKTPSTIGTDAGHLDQLGTKLTGVTDADGVIDFAIGMARDAGFDDDGKVTSIVTVATGPAASRSAAWSSGTDLNPPLNGKVAIALSPTSEQDGPVNPTLAGNRTFYDVFALDQFGNRVGGVPIELGYGNADDFDYSNDDVIADFDTSGDIWVTSFKTARIDVTGTWEDAPTYRYSDTLGAAVSDNADATGFVTSTSYEIQFGASAFSISSSATDTVAVGTPVSDTVRVIDQLGNPVVGYQVRFLRYGPDATNGDVVATKQTNALGEATYTFVGTKRGRAKVTAEVTDGIGRRVLGSTHYFGTTIKARLSAGKGGRGSDRLTVRANAVAAGARVQVYRVVKGQQVLVGTKRLSKKGQVVFAIRDRNRNRKTSYVAIVRSTTKSVADASSTVTIR